MRPWSSAICDRSSSMAFLYFWLSEPAFSQDVRKAVFPFKYNGDIIVFRS